MKLPCESFVFQEFKRRRLNACVYLIVCPKQLLTMSVGPALITWLDETNHSPFGWWVLLNCGHKTRRNKVSTKTAKLEEHNIKWATCGLWTPLTTLRTSARVLFCGFDGDLVLRSFFLICWDIWLEGSMMSKQVFPIRILWPLCIRNCWNMELISWEFCYEMSFQVLPSITGGATCISIGIGVCIIIQQSGSNAEIFEFSSKERWIMDSFSTGFLLKPLRCILTLGLKFSGCINPGGGTFGEFRIKRTAGIVLEQTTKQTNKKEGGHCSWQKKPDKMDGGIVLEGCRA